MTWKRMKNPMTSCLFLSVYLGRNKKKCFFESRGRSYSLHGQLYIASLFNFVVEHSSLSRESSGEDGLWTFLKGKDDKDVTMSQTKWRRKRESRVKCEWKCLSQNKRHLQTRMK
jgi:hypothetical protein